MLLNMLTAVTLVAAYQLLLGNFILGLIESALIKTICKQVPNLPLIIVGNYVSAFVGFGISSLLLDHTELNLVLAFKNEQWGIPLLAYTGIAFLLTLLVEYPFFYAGIRDESNQRLPHEELFSIICFVHVISYLFTVILWSIFLSMG